MRPDRILIVPAYHAPLKETPSAPAADRAEILAALADVDAVVIFPEPDVRALVREIRPDIHAKGTDYTAGTVLERDVVRQYGGRGGIGGAPKRHPSRGMLRRSGVLRKRQRY